MEEGSGPRGGRRAEVLWRLGLTPAGSPGLTPADPVWLGWCLHCD
jgi:hypothetical protein